MDSRVWAYICGACVHVCMRARAIVGVDMGRSGRRGLTGAVVTLAQCDRWLS